MMTFEPGNEATGSPLANARHEAFAVALVEGHTQTDAYLLAGYRPNRQHATSAMESLPMDETERRDRWRRWEQWLQERNRRHYEWRAMGMHGPDPLYDPWPAEFDDMRCGAKTRAGTPCKRIDLNRGGRCKLHGGYSTGPRTETGKARSSRNAAKRTP